MKIGIFTNTAYDIIGVTTKTRVIGLLIKSKYPEVHKPYKLMDWPLYHLPSDITPQFYRK
jgi:hypothetical protein